MKAIILAAGEGKRLGSLRHIAPKPLLPVAGRPTIQYVIDNIATIPEVDEIIVAMKFSDISDRVKRYFEETKRDGINIYPVGVLGWETGGDLKTAAYIAKIKEGDNFIVAYGDILTKVNLTDMLKAHIKSGKIVTMALFNVPNEDKKRFGIAVLNDKKEIVEFCEKPQNPDKINSNLANAGYYIFKGSFLGIIPFGEVRTADRIIPQLVKKHDVLGFEISPPYWLDIGTEDSYNIANRIILDEKGILPPPDFNSKR